MKVFFSFFCLIPFLCFSQQNTWQAFIDSSSTVCSPKSEDLNNDGIKDVIIGGGTDGIPSNYGIMAFNGADGSLLWQQPAVDEVFTRASFLDITNDGIKDIFIGGRHAQLRAIDGSNGAQLWEFFPSNLNPVDSGWYNFYCPQVIDDIDNDNHPDLLISNGGDHAAPAWQTNRPPGHLMVISSLTGQIIAKAVTPDSAEIYCSPLLLNVQNNGIKWVLYGTGGETLGGSFWAVPLDDLLNNDISNSIELDSDSITGFIAPASAYINESTGFIDFIIQSFGGKVTKFNGEDFSVLWSTDFSNTESSAEPVIANFTGTPTPDVFLVLFKGSNTSYTDFYQVLLDGEDGAIKFMDSIGDLHFGSGNAVDINNDGRDEAIISLNEYANGYYQHKLLSIDFENDTISQIGTNETGINLASTPLIQDIDNDNDIEIIHIVKKDSTNPGAINGYYLNRKDLNINVPNSGIAWGGYMGNNNDGLYDFAPIPCGASSVIASYSMVHPSCNGLNDGQLLIYPAGSGPHTFLWSTGSIDSSLSNLNAGTYTVRATNSQNCYEERSFTLIDPFLISFGNIFSPTCPGDTNGMATLSSTGCPCMFSSCVFLWDNGITTKPNTSLTEGWHNVSITHTNACVVIDSVYIPLSAAVLDSAITTPPICFGQSNGLIEVLTSQAVSPVLYTWQHGETGQTIDSLSAGNYTVYVQDARPCYDTLNVSVSEPDSIIMLNQIENVSCYSLSDGQLSLSANGGNGIFIYFLDSNSNASGHFSSLPPGNYSCYTKDSVGCVSDTVLFTINQPDSLNTSINSTLSSGYNIADGSASVLVFGGTPPYSYTWNDSLMQTDSIAINLTGGWYSVNVIDSNNCTIIDSVYVGAVSTKDMSSEPVYLYPNPTNNLIHISGLDDFSFEIMDLKGRVLSKGRNDNKISVESFADGIYVLKLENNGAIKNFFVVKE